MMESNRPLHVCSTTTWARVTIKMKFRNNKRSHFIDFIRSRDRRFLLCCYFCVLCRVSHLKMMPVNKTNGRFTWTKSSSYSKPKRYIMLMRSNHLMSDANIFGTVNKIFAWRFRSKSPLWIDPGLCVAIKCLMMCVFVCLCVCAHACIHFWLQIDKIDGLMLMWMMHVCLIVCLFVCL